LFSQSSNDLSRAIEVNIDRPSGAASLPTQSTVLNTSQLGSDDQTITDRLDQHQEELPLDTPLQKAPARTNPVRCGPPEGSTEHLTLLLDTVGHGKLPEDYQPSGLPPCEIIRQPGDIPDSWVAQSHFFPDAGLGYFFEIKGPYKRRGGALLAVYYGQDSYTRKFSKHSHKQLTELWSKGGGALSHRGANYVVDGDPACGPAYINDGFDTVNVYFSYSKANRRMKVRTRGPLDPGKYEALVNYDDPLYPRNTGPRRDGTSSLQRPWLGLKQHTQPRSEPPGRSRVAQNQAG
jgi:hypothetical protein